MPMPPDVESYLRSLAHRFNEPDLREAAKDVERLRAELAERDERIEELQDVGTKSIVDLQRAEKRIAELEAAKRTYIAPHGYVFAEEQIDAAWEMWSKYKDVGAKAAFAELSIVACEKCGGVGSWIGKTSKDPYENTVHNCPACHRNGKSHGWVWAAEVTG